MKDALPDRYLVDRVGTPDPADATYYVLDLVHDTGARVALRRLVRDYRSHGRHVQADELEKALDDSAEAHVRALQRLTQWHASRTGRRRSRS